MDNARLCAADVMVTDLITVTPETPLLDVHRLFVEEEIHGAPVVDENGRVYGLVTTLDLVRAVREGDDRGLDVERLTAEDAMTTELVMVAPDTPVDQLARTMVDQRIHRVLVGTERSLEGIVTALDLMRVMASGVRPEIGRIRHTGYTR